MIKQCKGKMLEDIVPSRLIDDNGYYLSTKYDGHYCQIHKIGNKVNVYTSGGKLIKLNDLEEFLVTHNEDSFILEAEFIGTSDGKKGDRTKCGLLTTWRTNTAKGLPCNMLDNKFMVFDIIVEDMPFQDRLKLLNEISLPNNLTKIFYQSHYSIRGAKEAAESIVKDGWEGIYLKHKNHLYRPGKRVNDAIKIKLRPSADLLCIGVNPGEGKYDGLVGSLVLQDSKGRVVSVGSGLDDYLRYLPANDFIGKIIEIEYEQILDTYIQPVYIRMRHDKDESD